MRHVISKNVLVVLLVLVIPGLAIATPRPPTGSPSTKTGGRSRGDNGSAEPKRSDDVQEPKGKEAPRKPRTAKKQSKAKSAVRLHLGGALLTSEVHRFAPSTYSLLGADYEQPLTGSLTYAAGARLNHTAVGTDIFEGLLSARYKLAKEKAGALPYLVVGAGVPVVSRASGNVFGVELRAGGGLSWKVAAGVRVGLELSGVYMFMGRPEAGGKTDDFGLVQLAVVPEFRF